MATLSVIVRTCGATPRRLTEALESLAQQTCRDFAVVLVDMGKVPALEIVSQFSGRLPALRHFVIGRRLNRPRALNAGIAASESPLIGILDDDNRYLPEHVEHLIRLFETSQAGLVYTGVLVTTYTGEGVLLETRPKFRDFSFDELVFRNYIYTVATGMRRSLWSAVGGFDPAFPVYEDHEFLIRAAAITAIATSAKISAESRSFTGDSRIRQHNFEKAACRRSLAGLRWKHRALYSDERIKQYAEVLHAEGISHGARNQPELWDAFRQQHGRGSFLAWYFRDRVPNAFS